MNKLSEANKKARISMARYYLNRIIKIEEDMAFVLHGIKLVHALTEACNEDRVTAVEYIRESILSLYRTSRDKEYARMELLREQFDTLSEKLIRETFHTDEMEQKIDHIIDLMQLYTTKEYKDKVVIAMGIGVEMLKVL